MTRGVVVTVDPGTPVRLEDDCPGCGWSDLWRYTLHHLTSRGVGTLATIVVCRRCGHRAPLGPPP